MAASKSKVYEYEFEIVPIVPEDFEGAVGVCNQATQAINYWKDQQRGMWNDGDKREAQHMIERWFVAKNAAQKVVASFQMRLW